jgi:hypothetical protein
LSKRYNKFVALCKADFKNFLYVVWKHLGLPEPTPVQYEIADFLQYGEKRKMIMAFRGVGKSWITSAYVIWRLLVNNDYKFLVVSASKQRSDDFSAFTKRLIADMPMLHHLKAKAGQWDTMIKFDVGPAKNAHAPSVKSVGIFGMLTGSRADEIIADDVEVTQNAFTESAREKLEHATKEFEAILVPGDHATITFLGTPQSEESIYNKLPGRGYRVIVWPARVPTPEKAAAYKGNLAVSIAERVGIASGAPTDPKRFTDVDLMEREASYGRSGFALQFMLDTSLSDAQKYPLKCSDLIVMSLNPEKAPCTIQWASDPDHQLKDIANIGFTGDRWHRPLFIDKEWKEYEGSIMFIDPSGRGNDKTGYAVVKNLHGYLFLTVAGGLSGGYDEPTLKTLAETAKEQKVNLIITESNFGDGMFNQLFSPVLRRIYPCALDEVRHSTQKERRIIDTLEPVMNRHRLIVDVDLIREDLELAQDDPKHSLFYQMTRITKDRGSLRHDDILEAVYGAVNYWVEAMARDEQQARKDHKNELLDKELEVFMDHALGGNRSSMSWFNL